MANIFHNVGLPGDGLAELGALMEVATRFGKHRPAPFGGIVQWGPDQGVELWTLIDPVRRPIVAFPHFVGASRAVAEVVKICNTYPDTPAGILIARLVPSDPATNQPPPLALHVSDFFAWYPSLLPGARVVVQIAAFAHHLICYRDQQDLAARSPGVAEYGVRNLVPTGILDLDKQPPEPLQAMAMLVGQIVGVDRRQNSLTKDPFTYLAIRTGGDILIDTVVHPDSVDGTPEVGAVAFVDAWLSAKLWPDQRLEQIRLFTPTFDQEHVPLPQGVQVDRVGIGLEPPDTIFTPAPPSRGKCIGYLILFSAVAIACLGGAVANFVRHEVGSAVVFVVFTIVGALLALFYWAAMPERKPVE